MTENNEDESIKEIDNFIFCYCGNSDTPHNFRHEFEPIIFIDKNRDKKGDFFVIDAEDFKGQTMFGKCIVPQCNASKALHGTIIKHDYSPSEEYIKRDIKFTIPLDTLCRVCNKDLENHNSLNHIFTTLIKVKNLGKYDEVHIKGKTDDQNISWSNP